MEVEKRDTAFQRPETPRLDRAAPKDPARRRSIDEEYGLQRERETAARGGVGGPADPPQDGAGAAWTSNPIAFAGAHAEGAQYEPAGVQAAATWAAKPLLLFEANNNPKDLLESTDERPSMAVDPGFSFKLYLLFGLVLADILVDAFTEPVRISDTVVHILTFSFQFFVRLATIMAFCLVSADILYIRMNFYDKYFYEFRVVFITFFISSVVFFSVRGYGLLLVYEEFPPMAVWTMHKFLYVYLYSIARVGNLVYYCVLVVSAQLACSERLYDRSCLR